MAQQQTHTKFMEAHRFGVKLKVVWKAYLLWFNPFPPLTEGFSWSSMIQLVSNMQIKSEFPFCNQSQTNAGCLDGEDHLL